LRQTSIALFKWLQEVSVNMLWRCSGELLTMFWRTFGDVLANFLAMFWRTFGDVLANFLPQTQE